MHIIRAKGADDALVQFMKLLESEGIICASPRGDVYRLRTPLTTIYDADCAYVSLSPTRDANPFFHMYEAIWMLGGQNNGKMLDQFIRDFSLRYGESGGRIWGAYGFRWRHHFKIDQLYKIIDILKEDPSSRQAVLSMWDAETDLSAKVNDKPCNLQVIFGIQDEKLNMMVTNRSNDMIFGAYGANIVHFNFLWRIMAAALNRQPGFYYQVSYNAHVYLDKIGKGQFSEEEVQNEIPNALLSAWDEDNALQFIRDADSYCDAYEEIDEIKSHWFLGTFYKAMEAHFYYKSGTYKQMHTALEEIEDSVWKKAMIGWVARRLREKIIKE